MRERWFGATGKRVPELARDGEIDVEGALVVDAIDAEQLRRAFDEGTPIVVRASSAEEVKVALARPEVSCVLVSSEELLTLDLTELTYG
ncbi:MAG: hypothetical protein ACRDNM_11825 [Gaiellaceae bacterium]